MQTLNRRSAVSPRSPFPSRRPGSFALPAVVALVALTAGPAQSAGDASSGTPPPGEHRIEVLHTATSWDNLSELFLGNTPAAAFSEGSVFVIRGEIRNAGDRSVHHVVLRYELLDDEGRVLQYADGFNRSAESMRPDEEGEIRVEDVKPIPAGGVDTYRMVFFPDEVPHFASQRVRVLDVQEKAPAQPPTAKPPTAEPATAKPPTHRP